MGILKTLNFIPYTFQIKKARLLLLLPLIVQIKNS